MGKSSSITALCMVSAAGHTADGIDSACGGRLLAFASSPVSLSDHGRYTFIRHVQDIIAIMVPVCAHPDSHLSCTQCHKHRAEPAKRWPRSCSLTTSLDACGCISALTIAVLANPRADPTLFGWAVPNADVTVVTSDGEKVSAPAGVCGLPSLGHLVHASYCSLSQPPSLQ